VSLTDQSWDHCLFLVYINDLPSVISYTLSNKNSSFVLFADDTSVIISKPCLMNFERKLNIVFQITKERFNSNFLSLNFDKTYYMQFITKNKLLNKINIEHDDKIILQTNFVNFLSITVDNIHSWKQHIDKITPNKACYIIRRSKLYLSNDALKMVYYAFFHSVMSYGLIFWGNSSHSKCVVKLQKRAIRIIMGATNNVSSTEFFKLLKILPLSAQYIHSLLKLVVNNRNLYLDNAELYTIKTRNSYNLHPPLSHLTKYQVHYVGISVFSHLPTSIKSIANETKIFKKTLKRFLLDTSYYSMDEYFNFKK